MTLRSKDVQLQLHTPTTPTTIIFMKAGTWCRPAAWSRRWQHTSHLFHKFSLKKSSVVRLSNHKKKNRLISFGKYYQACVAVCTQALPAAKHTNTDELLLSLWLRVKGQLGEFPSTLPCSLQVACTAKGTWHVYLLLSGAVISLNIRVWMNLNQRVTGSYSH